MINEILKIPEGANPKATTTHNSTMELIKQLSDLQAGQKDADQALKIQRYDENYLDVIQFPATRARLESGRTRFYARSGYAVVLTGDGTNFHSQHGDRNLFVYADEVNGIDVNGADEITTYGGDDVIICRMGNDSVYSGNGDDLIRGGIGNEHFNGGNGDDVIYGNIGHDVIDGGEGLDKITFTADGHDVIRTGSVADVVNWLQPQQETSQGITIIQDMGASDVLRFHGELTGTMHIERETDDLVIYEDKKALVRLEGLAEQAKHWGLFESSVFSLHEGNNEVIELAYAGF